VSEQLPPSPGTEDESRVASLRSRWASIGYGKEGMRSVQQEMKSDVEFLLGLAEEGLEARRRDERLAKIFRYGM